MAAPALLARLRQSRRTSLTVFAITLGTLVVTAVWFISARSSLAEAYAVLGERRQVLGETSVRAQEAQLRVDFARTAQEVVTTAQAHGLQPEAWGERLINLRQSQMSREETAALLANVTRDHSRMFGAEAFELSVTHQDEGLFEAPLASDRTPAPLSLTLRGAILFRTANTPDLQSPALAGVGP
jgi:hypothetical protein